MSLEDTRVKRDQETVHLGQTQFHVTYDPESGQPAAEYNPVLGQHDFITLSSLQIG